MLLVKMCFLFLYPIYALILIHSLILIPLCDIQYVENWCTNC